MSGEETTTGITYAGQGDLKPLPIPELEETCKKLLLNVEAFHEDEEDRKEAEQVIQEFLTKDAPKLQELLKKYDAEGRASGAIGSYVEDFWNDAYLSPESTVVMNLNPYFVLEDSPDPKLANNPLKRAANLCFAAVRFASQVRHETLRPDTARGKPICMDQFKALFGCARVPMKHDKDAIHVFDKSNHVAVMCQGDMYYFQALWPDGDVAVDEGDLVDILTAIHKHAMDDVKNGNPVVRAQNSIGVLTSLPRNDWAQARAGLCEHSAANAEALQIVDSALFVLVLDEFEPKNRNAVAANMLHGSYSLNQYTPAAGEESKETLYNEYQGGSCCNRWYDKLQMIVCKDGSAGINFEHSSIDGHTCLRFVSDVYAESVISFAQSITKLVAAHDSIPNVVHAKVKRAVTVLDSKGRATLDVFPKKLHFDVPEDIQRQIYYAETVLGDEIMTSETCVLDFKDYGKEFIKSQKMSPDSFVQMSMILAYYRLYGRIVCSYEPVLTKAFYHGRTEAMRPSTIQARRLCEAFVDPKKSNEEKIAALQEAVKFHGKYVKECAGAKGVDRHLFALKCIAQKYGEPIPAFYSSKPWAQLNHTILSTSNCGNACLAGFGFGPVVPEGLGVGYIIKDYQLHYSITSKQRQTRRYAYALESVLLDLAKLFSTTNSISATIHDSPTKKRQNLKSISPDMISDDAYGDIWGESTPLVPTGDGKTYKKMESTVSAAGAAEDEAEANARSSGMVGMATVHASLAYKELSKFGDIESPETAVEPIPAIHAEPSLSTRAYSLWTDVFDKAKQLEKIGKLQEACGVYRQLIDIEPYNGMLHLALATAEAKRETSSDPKQRYKHNNETGSLSDSPAALAYAEGVAKCPKDVTLWHNWGNYEEKRGNPTLAETYFQKALELDGQHSFACLQYGNFLARRGNTIKAEQIFARSLEKFSFPPLVRALAKLKLQRKDYQGVRSLYIRHLKALSRTRPDNNQLRLIASLAELEYLHLKNYQNAKVLYEQILSFDPTSLVALEQLHSLAAREHGVAVLSPSVGEDYYVAKQRLEIACKKMASREFWKSRGLRLFLLLARLELQADNPKGARDVLHRAMELYARSVDVLSMAGKVEVLLGNFDQAREYYSHALKLKPLPETMTAMAVLEYHHPLHGIPDLGNVRRLFEKVIHEFPRHGKAYLDYGNVEFLLGNMEKACEIFERGIRVYCWHSALIHDGYAQVLLAMGQVEKARKMLEAGIAKVNNRRQEHNIFVNGEYVVFHTLGTLEVLLGRYQKAASIFESGMNVVRGVPSIIVGAGLAFQKLGELDKARSLFQEVTQSNPNEVRAWKAWAALEAEEGNVEKAKQVLSSAIQRNPLDGDLWASIGFLDAQIGDVKTVTVLVEEANRKVPKHQQLALCLAVLQGRTGEKEKAIETCVNAREQNPGNGFAWLVYAQLLQKLGFGDDKAISALEDGIRHAPTYPELYQKLGHLFMEKGDANRANMAFNDGLAVNPLHSSLYKSLDTMHKNLRFLESVAPVERQLPPVDETEEPNPAIQQALSSRLRTLHKKKSDTTGCQGSKSFVWEIWDSELIGNIALQMADKTTGSP
eukprot:Nitzschia sp. Nitz4//scaffold138_size62050//4768//10338//NITZ4_006382-RA/size62050-augustus-gene-0.27-mRNA-1//-1//CDS//3329535749//4612//frame0